MIITHFVAKISLIYKTDGLIVYDTKTNILANDNILTFHKRTLLYDQKRIRTIYR